LKCQDYKDDEEGIVFYPGSIQQAGVRRIKMKKNRLAVMMMFLCLVCLVSVCASKPQTGSESQAESELLTGSVSQTESKPTTEFDAFSNIGVTAYLPNEYAHTTGVLRTSSADLSDFTDLSDGEGIYVAYLDYIGTADEADRELLEKGNYQERDPELEKKTVPLLNLIVIDRNRDVDELVKETNIIYGEEYAVKDELTLIGQAEDCSFYLREPGAEEMANIENLDDEFKNEYEQLLSFRDEIVKNMKFARVERPRNRCIGKKVSFETVDFDGNKVSSDEIFSQNEITMVNVWATWCPYCTDELPDLEELNQQLAEKNCGIIGLCGDAETDEVLNTAKELLSKNKITYLNLRPYDGWEENFDISLSGWPTSFFVDKTGTIVAPLIDGSQPQKYRECFDELLSKDTAAAEAVTSRDTAGAYSIRVSDQDSNPVEGVMVQLCTDKICKAAPTDSDGLSSFAEPAGVYEVHILKVPDGYKANEEIYHTQAVYGELNITIEKD
jgi:thiol-disulfide isomerase/thioredoxin